MQDTRILIVDDEESICFTFECFLSERGYGVATATGFQEALKAIAEENFDLIFADILLGDGTGIELLAEAHKLGQDCPVIMITGSPDANSAAEAVRLGAYDYIPKPVRFETLLRVTEKALQYQRLIHERERARAHLKAIFRSVRDGIVTVDPDLRLVQMNQAARELCLFSQNDIGQPLTAAGGCGAGRCAELLAEVIRRREPCEAERSVCRHAHRGERVMHLGATPLIDDKGGFSGAVLVMRDETRLVDLECALDRRRQCHGLTGQSRPMQKVYNLIDHLVDVPTTVLVTGESGTGKELVAEAIHHGGVRRDGPLVKVNCAALSEGLLESELFGHVRGAFTGAVRDKNGRFELAEGGTIFLDEIGEISPAVQAKLLRVLQEKEIERVGSSETCRIDVRIVAATNKDLAQMVRQGRFREDLYYRLKVVTLTLPPLRERREDIPVLIEHLLEKLNRRLQRRIAAVDSEVQQILQNWPWPGNVRELEHVLEYSAILCSGTLIRAEHLPGEFTAGGQKNGSNAEQDEATRVRRALEMARGNKSEAARALGVSRRTIYRRIAELGLD